VQIAERGGGKMSKIREITLRESRSEKDVSILVAKIDDDGDLILEGYDVGEAPKQFWGDDDYEYYRVVKKEYKDEILRRLVKERFKFGLHYKLWLRMKGIPNHPLREDDYKDTILLWLIKERFDSDTDFKLWLDKRGIPNQFWSWV
jgi:hypothetical protein